jgi:hypothetical protein
MKQPIKNCYWVIENKFLAGEYPRESDHTSSVKKISSLLKSGVTCFIDLPHPDDKMLPYRQLVEQLSNYPVDIHRYPIPDFSIPESKNLTRQILDQVDAVISKTGMVYVHCWGGIGRTGTIVGCWLARHGYPGEKALKRLHTLWTECPKSRYHNSPESKAQKQYVITWNENLRPLTNHQKIQSTPG